MHLLGRISLLFLSLSTSARCWQLTPTDRYPTLVSKLGLTPAMIEEMGGFDYVQAALANATLPGKSRRRRTEHGLEVRQGGVTVRVFNFYALSDALGFDLGAIFHPSQWWHLNARRVCYARAILIRCADAFSDLS